MLRVESSSLKLNQILEIRYFVETLSFTMQFEYWCLKLKNKVEVQTSSSARFDSFHMYICQPSSASTPSDTIAHDNFSLNY